MVHKGWVLTLAVAVLAGCLGDGSDEDDATTAPPTVDLTDLDGEGASARDDGDLRILRWEGSVGPGFSAPLVGGLPGADVVRHGFETKAEVGYIEVLLEPAVDEVPVFVALRDDQDRIACAWVVHGEPDGCTAAVHPETTGTVTYAVEVSQYRDNEDTSPETDVPYVVEIVQHPRHHLTLPDIDPVLSTNVTLRNMDTGRSGGEPTLGITSDGTIFVVEGTSTLRSSDDGETWDDVTPPGTTTSLDPMLYVDPWTDRVFVDHLYVACSYLSWSDDKGETWITNPAACGNTAIDHQKVAVGGTFLPASAYDGVVYFSYNSFALLAPNAAHLVVSRSLDGGVTWTPSVAATEALDFPYRTGGPIAADRDGNVYIPMYLTDGGFGVTTSNDHGATWNAERVGDQSAGGEGIDPGLAIDSAGNAYGAYWGEGAVRLSHSTDEGATWSDVVAVSPPELRSFVLADAAAGDEGRVAVAYLATPDTDAGPNRAPGYARWHLYLSYTEHALADAPHWETVRVTPADDPVQIGPICTGGVGCFGGNRNLLDFIDIQPGPDGRIHIAYTDGCLDDCLVAQESRDDQGYVAVQVDGPDLFADQAPWA